MAAENGAGDTLSMKEATQGLEKKMIEESLKRTDGNKSRAATLLGISYPSLLSKIKDYDLR